MKALKIGIIKETKKPLDRRTPLTPRKAATVQERYPHVQVRVEESDARVFDDQEYRDSGIAVSADVSDCDILMGVKEVATSALIPSKTYLFFSHTTKQQPYNSGLLRSILEKKIRLIDYEQLADNGSRLVAFGRYAGLVGAYNGLWAYGQRHGGYALRRAYRCADLKDMKSELADLSLPPIKILVTGNGRVSHGALELLAATGMRSVQVADFLRRSFDEPVYTQLQEKDYCRHKDGGHFDKSDFYRHPQNYIADFVPYAQAADLLIVGAYWDPRAPVLFTRQDMQDARFRIQMIADIACDIQGPIPSTKRATTIADPLYDYDPIDDRTLLPCSGSRYVTVMAIDNLPCELPRDSSQGFGKMLLDTVIPSLVTDDQKGIIAGATVAEQGELTKKFAYLEAYAYGTTGA